MSVLQLTGLYSTDHLLAIAEKQCNNNCKDVCCNQNNNVINKTANIDNTNSTVNLSVVPKKYLKRVGRGQKPINPEYVKWYFSKEGYKLFSVYEKADKPLKFICDKGHQHQIDWSSFRRGVRCKICHHNDKRISHEFVDNCFTGNGYKLLSVYENAKKPLKFECPNGHQHQINWNDFISGRRCAHCAGQIVKYEDVKKSFNDEGYTLLSKYVNSKKPLKFICNNGHQHQISWNHFRNGSRCGKCFQETLNGCSTLASSKIFQRTKTRGKSILPDDQLLTICEELASNLQTFYNDCPQGYHVDHVVPFTFFDHNDIDQIKACWSLYNLRYLPALENLSRGNRFDIDDIEKLPFSTLNYAIAIAVNAKNTPKSYKNAISHLIMFGMDESDYDEYWEDIITNCP